MDRLTETDDDDCDISFEDIGSDQDRYLTDAIIEDDVNKFVSMMYDSYNNKKSPHSRRNPNICRELFWNDVCLFGALDCATALLEGLPGVIVDLNRPVLLRHYPLHAAAAEFHCGLVELFIRYGARTDVGILKNQNSKGLLPLDVALESLHFHSYLVDWTPDESIYKLVTILCLPQMRKVLETNRLLALSTKDVKEVFKNYARDGRLLEMAVLLMAAKEQIMVQTHCKDDFIVDEFMIIRKSIKQKIASGVDERVNLVFGNGQRRMGVRLCDAKWKTMITFDSLLGLFEMAGDAIAAYLQSQDSNVTKEMVVNDVATVLEKAGIKLADENIDLSNIDCKSSNNEDSKVKEAKGPLEKLRGYQSLGKRLILHSGAARFRIKKQMPWRIAVYPHFIQHFLQVRYCRAFHSDPSAHFLRSFSIPDFHKSTDKPHSNGETNAIQRTMLPFRSSNQVAFLASSLKRAIKRL